MKGRLLAGVCVVSALASSAALADDIVPAPTVGITVDENGNGSMTSPNGTTPIPGTVITDPTSTAGSKVLAYTLPGVVASGDIVITEPNTTEPANSDLIRFFTPATGAQTMLLFYSDLAGAGEAADIADLGVPPAAPGAKVFAETGLFAAPYTEAGPNGLVYMPAAGDPGSATGAILSYTLISDAASVPLPASAGAGLVLLMGLGASRIRKRVTI